MNWGFDSCATRGSLAILRRLCSGRGGSSLGPRQNASDSSGATLVTSVLGRELGTGDVDRVARHEHGYERRPRRGNEWHSGGESPADRRGAVEPPPRSRTPTERRIRTNSERRRTAGQRARRSRRRCREWGSNPQAAFASADFNWLAGFHARRAPRIHRTFVRTRRTHTTLLVSVEDQMRTNAAPAVVAALVRSDRTRVRSRLERNWPCVPPSTPNQIESTPSLPPPCSGACEAPTLGRNSRLAGRA
jgi:hypothetical protein